MTLKQFDHRVAACVGRLPHGLMVPFLVLGWLSAPLCWAVILLVIYIMEPATPTPLWVMALLPLSGMVKLVVRRARPEGRYAESQRIVSYSFPSSHTYSATLAGGYVALLLLNASLLWAAAGIIGLIGLIGISRVFIGAHYPSDVLGGWILGVMTGIVFACVT